MADEDAREPPRAEARFSKLKLGALAAIEEEQLGAAPERERRQAARQGGRAGAGTQEGDPGMSRGVSAGQRHLPCFSRVAGPATEAFFKLQQNDREQSASACSQITPSSFSLARI